MSINTILQKMDVPSFGDEGGALLKKERKKAPVYLRIISLT